MSDSKTFRRRTEPPPSERANDRPPADRPRQMNPERRRVVKHHLRRRRLNGSLSHFEAARVRFWKISLRVGWLVGRCRGRVGVGQFL